MLSQLEEIVSIKLIVIFWVNIKITFHNSIHNKFQPQIATKKWKNNDDIDIEIKFT